jgi:tripartite-type tricarboxylate transporter receptor subunit TctC
MIQQSAHPFIGSVAAAVVWAATSIAVEAQPATFPSGTIRFVAPFSASTPPDIISRIVAKELSENEGWRVVVENRPGGVTTIAAGDVLSQPADGLSIYAMSVPSAAAPSLVPNISYRLDTDFEPVIKASVSYNVLVVNPSVPANSVAELVALLKSQPDKFTFSSGGFGTPAHLIGEQFKLQTGARAQHVPYQQFPQAIGDLLNGTNAFMFITMLPVIDLIKTGKLRALAVTGLHRSDALRDVPTGQEAGMPRLVVTTWNGVLAPAGTPSEVVERLHLALAAAVADPALKQAFAALGAETESLSPQEFAIRIRNDFDRWSSVIKQAGISAE